MSKKTLTDEEVLAQLAREKAERERMIREARENLEKYGSTIAPIGAVEVKDRPKAVRSPKSEGLPRTAVEEGGVIRIAPRAKKKIDPKWFKVLKTCPHCGEEKNVGKDFGIVVRRGLESASGWCRACRNAVSYKNRQRKNRTSSDPERP